MHKYSFEFVDLNMKTLTKSNITVDTGLKEKNLLLRCVKKIVHFNEIGFQKKKTIS